MTDPRSLALAHAIDALRGRDDLNPAKIIDCARSFFGFLTEAETPAPPAAAAKPAAKAADPKPTEKPAEKPAVDPKPTEKPAEKPAAKAAAKGKEVTDAEAKQAVVKMVTKIGRDPTIAFMRETFGSPNISGLDLTKHSYADVIKGIDAHIAALAEVEQSPAE